ncbi:hypothetical protein L6164_025585 [Bauhinia variegata]|uniref:Uncharacterized protein n=1 Tax=Bauhinia variegata TaxID=167791 RepID=A0ACB9M196_BAUVA|nr:hypothetical protein L6164_025585 [Bauhinia variegata]
MSSTILLAPLKGDAPPEVSRRIPMLPEEIIAEILLRIPVKSLLQFRCVCKSWKSIISDPQFVKKHLHRSTTDANFSRHRVVFSTETDTQFVIDGIIECSIHSLFNNPATSVDASYRMTPCFKVVGSCNGLLCLASITEESSWVRLWNPTTRWVSKIFPYLGDGWRTSVNSSVVFGFGHDHLIDNYKVVSIFYTDGHGLPKTVKVCTLGDNSWTQMQSFPSSTRIFYDSGKFVGGSLNWLVVRSDGPCYYFVVSFNLAKETCDQLLLPDNDSDQFLPHAVEVLRDSLCFTYGLKGTHFVLWLMKEYGVKESWTKLVTIPYVDIGVSGNFFGPTIFSIRSETGEVLFGVNFNQIAIYNPRDNTLRYPQIKDYVKLFDPVVYIESMVSPCC